MFNALSTEQQAAIAVIAAGFTGLLSLFNIGGRFFWASLSDYIGRKNTYYAFFILGIALYALAPSFANAGSGESMEGNATYRERTVAYGDTSQGGMLAKARHVT